jgi:hypothetical protein
MNAHANITAADALSDAIADEIAANLEALAFDAQQPETEAEALIEVHRRRIDRHGRRIANTRKSLKLAVADLEAKRKALKAKFEADMVDIAERIASARDKAARDIAADQRMLKSSETAASVLMVE